MTTRLDDQLERTREYLRDRGRLRVRLTSMRREIAARSQHIVAMTMEAMPSGNVDLLLKVAPALTSVFGRTVVADLCIDLLEWADNTEATETVDVLPTDRVSPVATPVVAPVATPVAAPARLPCPEPHASRATLEAWAKQNGLDAHLDRLVTTMGIPSWMLGGQAPMSVRDLFASRLPKRGAVQVSSLRRQVLRALETEAKRLEALRERERRWSSFAPTTPRAREFAQRLRAEPDLETFAPDVDTSQSYSLQIDALNGSCSIRSHSLTRPRQASVELSALETALPLVNCTCCGKAPCDLRATLEVALLEALHVPTNPHHGALLEALEIPGWQRLLHRVRSVDTGALRAADLEAQAPQGLERLVFRVALTSRTLEMTPVVQTLGKNGRFGRGRALSPAAFVGYQGALSPEDLALRGCFSRAEYGGLDIPELLPLLEGHPRLIHPDDPQRSVRVERASPVVTLAAAVDSGHSGPSDPREVRTPTSDTSLADPTEDDLPDDELPDDELDDDELDDGELETDALPDGELETDALPDGELETDALPDDRGYPSYFGPQQVLPIVSLGGLPLGRETLGFGPKTLVTRNADGTRIVFGIVPPAIVELLHILAKGPVPIPVEGQRDLLDLLVPWQPHLSLELPEFLRGETLTSPGDFVVQLTPEGDGLVRAALRLRQPEASVTWTPGEGGELIVQYRGESETRLTLVRALADERERATQLAETLRLDRGHALPAFEYELRDPDALLDLLAVCREHPELATLEWAKGSEPWKLVGRAQLGSLRVAVRGMAGLLNVEGHVEVDGSRASLRDLIDAVRAGRRYVRVGPHAFAVIESSLRERLAASQDAVSPTREGLQAGVASLPALDALVAEPDHLEVEPSLDRILAAMRSSSAAHFKVPKSFRAELRDYQREGYEWLMRLASWGAGACLADEMGLGKTIQALAMLVARQSLGPALVIAPTSVEANWLNEAARFAPTLRVLHYRGADRASLLSKLGPKSLVVTSYDLMLRDHASLADHTFATLVLDEAQNIKNALAKRAKAVSSLRASWRVALTGTPLENHLGELWSLLFAVSPGLLGGWPYFSASFAVPIERHGNTGRREALSRLIRPFVLRRTKALVAAELPPRTEVLRLVELSAKERALYDAEKNRVLESLVERQPSDEDRFAVLAAITRLRQLACHPRLVLGDTIRCGSAKLNALVELVTELRSEGHRALIFSQFTSYLALAEATLKQIGVTQLYLDGSTPAAKRRGLVDRWQAGEGDVFLISLKAGGTGLNLTGADYVIHLDPWWNPAVEDQASDRAHRIGQTRAVTIVRLVAAGTIEEAVLRLHERKRELAAAVLEGSGAAARLSVQDLAALIVAGSGPSDGDDDPPPAPGASRPNRRQAQPA